MKLPTLIQKGLLYSLILCCAFLITTASADQKSAHKDGKDFAKSQAAKNKQAVKKIGLTDVPGYKTSSPPEAGMGLAQLDARKAEVLSTNENASFLAKTINEKPYVKIDPVNDAAFKRANDAAANPLQTINQGDSDGMVQDLNAVTTRHTCEESRESTTYVCAQTRIIEKSPPTTLTHIVSLKVRAWRWKGGLSRNIITGEKLDASYTDKKGKFEAHTTLKNPLPKELHARVVFVKLLNGNDRTTLTNDGKFTINTYMKNKKKVNLEFTVDVEITYRPLIQNTDIQEHISDTCGPLKAKAAAGICKFIKEKIVDGEGDKDFNAHSISRPWWKKEVSYECHYPSMNNCDTYRQRGCEQVGTTCKTKVGDTCAVSEQTFVCREKVKRIKDESPSKHGVPFCLDGTCSQPTVVANTDMMEAISRLSVIKEAQGEITKDNLSVFKGGVQACGKNITNFKDCCGTGKGWGKSIGMASCKPDEKQLEESRSKGLCHQIGTYCSKKSPLGCMKEKTTFCCFTTKIAKIFHEQGRKQLGIGWGDKKNPDCRGFTIEELSKLDFSKLDLQELYEDIAKNMKKPDLANVKRGIQNRVDVMVLDNKKEAKI